MLLCDTDYGLTIGRGNTWRYIRSLRSASAAQHASIPSRDALSDDQAKGEDIDSRNPSKVSQRMSFETRAQDMVGLVEQLSVSFLVDLICEGQPSCDRMAMLVYDGGHDVQLFK